MTKKHLTLRSKLILSFSVVILIGVTLSSIMAIHLIGDTIIRQVQDKVRLDLNTAREIYQSECRRIKNVVRLTSKRFFIKEAILQRKTGVVTTELQNIKEMEALDIFNLMDSNGVILTEFNHLKNHSRQLDNIAVKWVISKKNDIVTTQIISSEYLEIENRCLAERARIFLIPTSKARPRSTTEETSGMVISAASPVFDNKGNLVGILYGAKLLNRNYDIVDRVKDIVYRGERYKGKDIGTATIFQGDIRISTNVMSKEGGRAIGTRVSREVYHQVLVKGIPWIGRAFVVNDWYITAYEPIRNHEDKIIGMLYVGLLEAPYVEIRNQVLFTFLTIAGLSIIILSFIAYYSSSSIIKPIKKLLVATKKVSAGDLSHRVGIKSRGEFGQLAESFNHMTGALQKATKKYLLLNRTLKDKVNEKSKELENAQGQLIQNAKLTSLGKLAAGIAHELNNPLTSILLNSHTISDKLGGKHIFKENLKLIIDETNRCAGIVRGLLEFSRQTPPKKVSADVNELIEQTLKLLKSQILVQKVYLTKNFGKNVPNIMVDINKMQQVFTNVILNALNAMPGGGELVIYTRYFSTKQAMEIKFQDCGIGIKEENIGRIFDPFFTTKGTEGTGLGLSVSYGIVQQHGGIIHAQSNVDKGTTITIRLPLKGEK